MFVNVRNQGARIDSVPLKQLEELSACSEKRWYFENGWLILEGS
jgi:hypothetical protein